MSETMQRNDRALFLSPLAAPIVLLLARLATGPTATGVASTSVAFWALVEAGAYAGIWLLLGWVLAWVAWKAHLARSIRRSAIGVAIVLLLVTFVLSLFGRAYSAPAQSSIPFEAITVAMGTMLNLSVFLLFQHVSPNPSFKRTPDGAA